MTSEPRPRTAAFNAPLWGSRARDWADLQESLCRPMYLAAYERLGLSAGCDHLDVGCGAGLAAQLSAERGASVRGLDASPNMLAIAQERVPTADFLEGDLEALPYADDRFDLVTGFNSFQYAGNPGVALGEAKRVARPGGQVLIMTWGDPEGMEAASLVRALGPLLPLPPPGAPGPFALSDEVALRAFATGAGLEPQEVFDVPLTWHYADLTTALLAQLSSGVSARAIAHSGEEAVKVAYHRALEPYRQTDGSYTIGASFRCLTARA
ncbi:class I SAM-dependent methyltransferase [Deinococcus detaillensis]|uniref:Class I SAM-dependent methyltransferase n=1 Tax=Deinococcus detaillensis TaxID=2592048 RepID=A0A553V5R4_9DEIO|nr:class I SAM-dependent methyltransferase [Deinococcus detaillensis]TSA87813.1 class I SAM-dependent methyltransferase [Deinococcus detaillensis]